MVKNWLVQRKKKLELAPRRTWKRYWVCLKGTVLLFFDGDVESAMIDENVPRHLLGEKDLKNVSFNTVRQKESKDKIIMKNNPSEVRNASEKLPSGHMT